MPLPRAANARRCFGLLLTLAAVAPCAAAADAVPKPPPTLSERANAHVAALPPSRVKAMLTAALANLGVPYKWGGDEPAADGGFDCVGLAYASYHAAGLEFPFPRFSTINMTPLPRGPDIAKVWWTEYVGDFAKAMQDCSKLPLQDGDVLVYHALTGASGGTAGPATIGERTGHAVIVVDAKHGYAVSAAHGGVRVHALGDLKHYDGKALTACWRAASAALPPRVQPAIQWTIGLGAGRPQEHGTHAAPYRTSNPLDVVVTATGAEASLAPLRFEATGRVLSLIGFVSPEVTVLPAPAGTRRWRLHHDFKKTDLPVDPGEHIPTPQRRIVARLFDKDGLLAASTVFYAEFHPYW